MKELSYWDAFLTTGRVEDYLKCRCVDYDSAIPDDGRPEEEPLEAFIPEKEIQEEAVPEIVVPNESGEYPDAGLCFGDRNDHEINSCW